MLTRGKRVSAKIARTPFFKGYSSTFATRMHPLREPTSYDAVSIVDEKMASSNSTSSIKPKQRSRSEMIPMGILPLWLKAGHPSRSQKKENRASSRAHAIYPLFLQAWLKAGLIVFVILSTSAPQHDRVRGVCVFAFACKLANAFFAWIVEGIAATIVPSGVYGALALLSIMLALCFVVLFPVLLLCGKGS